MIKNVAILLFLMIQCLSSLGQERLELLETNIKKEIIDNYTDSYLWTKNWWLTSGKIVDTSRGGNNIANKSLLTKQGIDSLYRVFTGYISPEIIRFGNLVPRIVYNLNARIKPYILSTVYEIKDGMSKPIIQFKIEFDKRSHNSMQDVFSIAIIDPDDIKSQPYSVIYPILKRKATTAESNITPPMVKQGNEK